MNSSAFSCGGELGGPAAGGEGGAETVTGGDVNVGEDHPAALLVRRSAHGVVEGEVLHALLRITDGAAIQEVEYIGFTSATVFFPSRMGNRPRVVEAPTFTSQSARAFPFGKEVSTWPWKVMGSVLLSLRFANLATSGQGAGPECSQMLCQWEAKIRPPLSA